MEVHLLCRVDKSALGRLKSKEQAPPNIMKPVFPCFFQMQYSLIVFHWLQKGLRLHNQARTSKITRPIYSPEKATG